MNASMYPHTARQLGCERIAYQFHPFFQQSVSIVRRTRHRGVRAVMVCVEGDRSDSQGAPELRMVIPDWMLDEVACMRMEVQEKPQIQLQAILHLRALIDQVQLDE